MSKYNLSYYKIYNNLYFENIVMSSFSKFSGTSPTSQFILQPCPSLYLRHRSFSNPSVASPTSQLILQPFFRFSYVTGFHLRHLASRPWFDPRSGQVSWVKFFRGFSSPVKQMSGSFRPRSSPNIIW